MNVVVGDARPPRASDGPPGPAMGGATRSHRCGQAADGRRRRRIGRHCRPSRTPLRLFTWRRKSSRPRAFGCPPTFMGLRLRWPPCAIGRRRPKGPCSAIATSAKAMPYASSARVCGSSCFPRTGGRQAGPHRQRLISDHRRVRSRVREGPRRDSDQLVLAPWTTVKYRISEAAGGRRGRHRPHRLHRGPAGADSAASPNDGGGPPTGRLANVDQILVRAISDERPLLGRQADCRPAAARRHKLSPGESDDFAIRDLR